VRARHPLTRAPSTCDVGVDVSLRSGSVVMCSFVYNNAGLCGPLVSVGSVGTNYNCYANYDYNGCDGLGGTNLGNACPLTDSSVDSNNRNGIMRAAISGATTDLAIALADPAQNVRRSPRIPLRSVD